MKTISKSSIVPVQPTHAEILTIIKDIKLSPDRWAQPGEGIPGFVTTSIATDKHATVTINYIIDSVESNAVFCNLIVNCNHLDRRGITFSASGCGTYRQITFDLSKTSNTAQDILFNLSVIIHKLEHMLPAMEIK